MPVDRTKDKGSLDPGRVTGDIHHHMGGVGQQAGHVSGVVGQGGGDAQSVQQCQLFRVTPDDGQVASRAGQGLSHQIAQPTIPQDIDPAVWTDVDLFQNAQGRGQGFNKDGLVIWQGSGHTVQIGHGHGQIVGKGPVPVIDAQGSPIWAVVGQTLLAQSAFTAAVVDLADHPTAQPLVVSWGGDDGAHKFVTQHAAESTFVALQQLQIRGAHPGQMDPDQHFVSARFGDRGIGPYFRTLIGQI